MNKRSFKGLSKVRKLNRKEKKKAEKQVEKDVQSTCSSPGCGCGN